MRNFSFFHFSLFKLFYILTSLSICMLARNIDFYIKKNFFYINVIFKY